ncbi:COX15/CtaA family protein [Leucobacter sp. CX328]|uniref:COX15/CtaA family protein n=1 Tax=unclassified Leucobacter TaxID=2621730 RepID=UPI00334143C6
MSEVRLPRTLKTFAWISFLLNVLIIATGGAVRLTGSGLGCTEWPLCTPGSLVPTAELSYHSLIEFGNRTISGPLLIAALAVVILTRRIRAQRRDLSILSWLVLSLVLLQAFVGGVVVWVDLAAFLVGFHYIVSLIIIGIAAAYVVLMKQPAGPRVRVVPKGYAILSHVSTLGMAILIIMGVLTTASGPHSGDENVIRNGFDASFLAHLHAWPGYITGTLLVILMVWSIAKKLPTAKWAVTLALLVFVQILVGIYQARNGLPALVVGVHMVLAALSVATMTAAMLSLKRPNTSPIDAPVESVPVAAN